MDIKFSAASNAYADAINRVAEAPAGAAGEGLSAAAGTPSFSELVANAAQGAEGALQKSETVSLQAITGSAGLTDVVTAVTSAEVTLRTVVAVRDRLISAYQEIMKTPI